MPFKKQLIVDLLHSVVDYEKIDAVKFALAIISGITDDVRKEVASMFESLKEFAKELDWRDPSKSAYDLTPMLFMYHIGGMMGKTKVVDLRHFWQTNRQWLVFLHPSLGAVPSRSLLGSIKRHMDQQKVTDFYEGLNIMSFLRFRFQDGSYGETDIVKRLHLSTDGQTLNGTHLRKYHQGDESKIKKTSGLDVVSIFCYQYGRTVNLRIRDVKNHETEAIIEMLEQTPDVYRNAIISFDALNTHESLLNVIINEAHADYFCALKSNQDKTFSSIVRAFDQQWERNKSQAIVDCFDTEDGTNTNNTVRTDIRILPASVLDNEDVKSRFPHMKSVVEIKTYSKNLTSENESYNELRYFITSLEADLEENPNVARDFVTIKLRRWAIETGHFYVDKNLDQDRIVFRRNDSAFFSAAVNKTVMNALLPYVEWQKFNSDVGPDFSVKNALTDTNCMSGTGIAASLLTDTVGFDLQLLLRKKKFEAALETEGGNQEYVLSRYIYHIEESAPLNGGNGDDAGCTVPHGQQLKKSWTEYTQHQNFGTLKMVSKDDPQYADQGAVLGKVRLILTSLDPENEKADLCNFEEFMEYYEDDNKSVHSADHLCRNKFRKFQRHNDADGYAAKCQRKKRISRPTAEKQAA